MWLFPSWCTPSNILVESTLIYHSEQMASVGGMTSAVACVSTLTPITPIIVMSIFCLLRSVSSFDQFKILTPRHCLKLFVVMSCIITCWSTHCSDQLNHPSAATLWHTGNLCKLQSQRVCQVSSKFYQGIYVCSNNCKNHPNNSRICTL